MQNIERPAFCQPRQKPTQHQIRYRSGPRLRRQSPNLRELRTKKTRTAGSRNVLPRLLTRIQDMWLLDLREPRKESHDMPISDHRSKRVPSRQNVTRKPMTSPPRHFRGTLQEQSGFNICRSDIGMNHIKNEPPCSLLESSFFAAK